MRECGCAGDRGQHRKACARRREPVARAPRPPRVAPQPSPTATKVARVHELLVEAADLIDELRGGEPARRFRKWIAWWDKLSAAAVARTSWRYRRSRRDGITIENATTFPTAEIAELVRFVFEGRPRPKRVQVRFRRRDDDVYGLTSPAGGTVRAIVFAERETVDHHYPDLAGAPTYTTYDWREELVTTLAHEAVHVAAAGTSELEAERHAVSELRRYRLEHPLRAIWVRLRSW